MNLQRGFILQGQMLLYGALGAGAIILALTAAVWVQTARLSASEAKYDLFVGKTKAIGDAQILKTKETDAKHERIVKEKDNELSLARSRFNDDVKRLRNKHSSSSPLPQAPPNSSKPNLACFDRGELNLALRGFVSEVDGLIVEGQSCAIELNNAREWAKSIKE